MTPENEEKKAYLESYKRQKQKLRRLEEEIAACPVSRSIMALPDPKCRELLRRRYILLEGWQRIADEMGCSEDHARGKLHGTALEMFLIKK